LPVPELSCGVRIRIRDTLAKLHQGGTSALFQFVLDRLTRSASMFRQQQCQWSGFGSVDRLHPLRAVLGRRSFSPLHLAVDEKCFLVPMAELLSDVLFAVGAMGTTAKQIPLSVLESLREDLTYARLNNGNRVIDVADVRQYIYELMDRIRATAP
jgi:hypothetical protein